MKIEGKTDKNYLKYLTCLFISQNISAMQYADEHRQLSTLEYDRRIRTIKANEDEENPINITKIFDSL
jgi:hypothetical protein